MYIEYSPEGQATQTFEWNPGRIRLGESAAIETQYSKLVGEGKTIQQFINDVRMGSAAARRVLLFRLLRKQHPKLRFDDVDPYEDEVKVVANRQELEELRATVAGLKNLTEAEKAQMLSTLDEEIADAPESGSSGKSTGSSTPTTDLSQTSGETTT